MRATTRRRLLALGMSALAVLAGSAVLEPAAGPAGVAPPPGDGRFDYQIGGAYPPATDVSIVGRDRSEPPAPGRYSICYVNAFQTQPEEAGWWQAERADLLLRQRDGTPVADADWPGEILLDTSTPSRRAAIAGIVGRWLDDCAARGYQAVEPDNLDSFTRSGGLLRQSDNLALAALLATRAHRAGLAFAQKNTAELGPAGRRAVGFDFAIAEECEVYAECDAYTDVYGPNVIEIEYTDNPRSAYRRACVQRGDRIPVILRDRDVVPADAPGYRYAAC